MSRSRSRSVVPFLIAWCVAGSAPAHADGFTSDVETIQVISALVERILDWIGPLAPDAKV